MSSHVLKIFSTDPHFEPANQQALAARTRLQQLLPEGEMCEAEFYEHVNFIDAGESLTRVVCPLCRTENNVGGLFDNEEIYDWWDRTTEECEESGKWEADVRMPCCGRTANMLELSFDVPAGFARFELSIWNPGTGDDLSREDLASIERILGCALRQVWAWY